MSDYKRYNTKTKIEARRLFIQEGFNAKQISREFGNKPTHQTISNWAKTKNKNGLSWKDERAIFVEQKYQEISPQGMVNKILEKIWLFMNKDIAEFSTKDADAISKLRVALEKITDKKYQVPVMYSMLTDLVKFIKEFYPDLLTEDLLNAVKHFKNDLSNRLDK